MNEQEEEIVSKALDILYKFYCSVESSFPIDPKGDSMKETLYDDFIEYENGNKNFLIGLLKDAW